MLISVKDICRIIRYKAAVSEASFIHSVFFLFISVSGGRNSTTNDIKDTTFSKQTIKKFLILSYCRSIYMRVRRSRDGTATGKGLVGDNSTDPLAANSQTGSADEVR